MKSKVLSSAADRDYESVIILFQTYKFEPNSDSNKKK